MNQPYSVVAGFLNELHALPEWIQALWLLAVPLTVVGTAYCAARAVRDVALALIDRRGVERGRPVYAIYETPDGRFMLTLEQRIVRGGKPGPLFRTMRWSIFRRSGSGSPSKKAAKATLRAEPTSAETAATQSIFSFG